MPSEPRYASVVFDCDSTLAALEGIDALCAALPPDQAAEVAALTDAAMNGEVPLADVYERRLAIVRPSADDLEAVGRRYVETMVPGTREVVRALRDRGVSVAIVSGGLAPAVRVLARELGVHDDDVHAVDVQFDAEGRYVDFDRTSPLWRNQGKVDVLVAPLDGALQPTLPRVEFVSKRRRLSVGDEVNPVALVSDLMAIGYDVVDRVECLGQVSRRGGIVDLFPPGVWMDRSV